MSLHTETLHMRGPGEDPNTGAPGAENEDDCGKGKHPVQQRLEEALLSNHFPVEGQGVLQTNQGKSWLKTQIL